MVDCYSRAQTLTFLHEICPFWNIFETRFIRLETCFIRLETVFWNVPCNYACRWWGCQGATNALTWDQRRSIFFKLLKVGYSGKHGWLSMHNKVHCESLPFKPQLTLIDAGLEYLHDKCSPSIIHCDVKSNNILLTRKLIAKVADFGLS